MKNPHTKVTTVHQRLFNRAHARDRARDRFFPLLSVVLLCVLCASSSFSAPPQTLYRDPATGLIISGSDGTAPLKYRAGQLFSNDISVDSQLSTLTSQLSNKQPLDTDLTAIAGIATTAYGRNALALADAAAFRTYTGLGTLATQSGTFSGTSSGTNTGDNAVNTLYSGLVSNATHTGDVTGATALTLATTQPAVHTWSLAQTFTVAPVFTDQSGSRSALGLGTLATQSGTFSGTSSGTNTGDNAVNTLYSGLVSNATHTGDVTGATALTLATTQPAVHTWSLAQTFTVAPVFTDPSGTRTALGLTIGTNVQAFDADLTSLAAASGTNTIYYRSAANTWSAVTIGGNLTFSAGTLNAVAAPAETDPVFVNSYSVAGDLVTYDGSSTATLPVGANHTFLMADTSVPEGLSWPTAANARSFLGLGTAATANTGTSGANIPILNVANTWGATQTFTSPVINSLPTGTGIASASTASTLVSRDSSANITANNWIGGYTTTATASGTTTLTVASSYGQFFTGSTTQTVTLPVASTLTLGHQFVIQNNSTGAVTVNSSGANAVIVLAGGTSATLTCILTSGTTAASWNASYSASIPTSGQKYTFPTTSATIARTDAANTFTGHQTIEGVTSAGATGTNNLVFSTSPTLVTPVLGAATATTINGVTIDNNAWTTYTPTITSGAGTFSATSASGRYKQIGKTVFYEMDIGTTTVGTASGEVRATLPFTNGSFRYTAGGLEYNSTGKQVWGYIDNAATYIRLKFYDATFPGTSGNIIAISGAYEVP